VYHISKKEKKVPIRGSLSLSLFSLKKKSEFVAKEKRKEKVWQAG
jgi:hypothetical protein